MQMSVDPHDDLVDQLTTDQKSEIVNFYNINPDLSEDIIRENYAEKFKKIITPDMLSKIIRPGELTILTILYCDIMFIARRTETTCSKNL